MLQKEDVTFLLGDVLHTVKSDEINAETSLNEYLREKLNLTGTKRMCLEGGCGACIVAVEENVDAKKKVFAVNSCLVSILRCQGWKINTIEGIGNPVIGYHPLQKLLAENNGSQCGYCSGGMVMNMYALQKSGQTTKSQIENSFGGNLCRCTGYRPILEAFKKVTSDSDSPHDIEDLPKRCRHGVCNNACGSKQCPDFLQSFYIDIGGKSKWIKVHNFEDLIKVLKGLPPTPIDNYMLVGGNTAHGVYKPVFPPEVYIDVTSVKELTSFDVQADALVLGANLTLKQTMDIFYETAKESQFSFLSAMADHIDLVATVPVRNIGTLAGNLMTKYTHNEFPSDIFLIMETVEAVFTIVDTSLNEIKTTPKDFLKIDMSRKVLKLITIKALDDTYKYSSYKVMPRAQNAHAMVNAGFLFQFNNNIVKSARMVYGGINPQFVHAANTEDLLKGKNLFDNAVLQKAFKSLDAEVVPDYVLPDPTPAYRKGLAIALFYRYVLKIAPKNLITPKNLSGGTNLERPLSTGSQEFGTDKTKWPVTQPVIKMEALAQTSGQAQYIDDIPDRPNQLFAALVTAKAPANSTIIKIDPSKALRIDGVVAFYDKDDIPGENTFTPEMIELFTVKEEIFCSGQVQYYDQPIGVVVANDEAIAWRAASLVEVDYQASPVKPFLNVKEVLEAQAKDRITALTEVVPKSKGTDVKKVVKGHFYNNWQYHFHMETQCCNVIPVEDDGLNVHASTQWMDSVQAAISAALKIPLNKINVFVRRLGGAFGAKILRNSQVSAAAALPAHKLRRPVKIRLPLQANMSAIGRRMPVYVKYEVGVNGAGVVQYLEAELYTDVGVSKNEATVDVEFVTAFENCYDIDTWKFTTFIVKTDTAANCFARAPGSLQGIAAIESIMEHIAYELNLDPVTVKMANFNKAKYPKIAEYWKDMETWTGFEKRRAEIKSFNDANRWKKRGLSIAPMVFLLAFDNAQYPTIVSIFHGDGTVAITHGGIEMGQGINTKACQACAYKFGIDLKMVTTQPSYSAVTPNAFISGNSMTSESVCYAVMQACDVLLERMKPIRKKMENPTWLEVVQKCYSNGIQLNSTGFMSFESPGIQNYDIFGMATTEVEVDILTGQKQIELVDIIEDAGDAISPLLDVGQVEGAFVMGIGYQTTEEMIFDDKGALTNNRSWNYKPPGAKDIPIDFRIRIPKNNPNPVGVLHSKAIAEPPMCLSVSVPLAIRNAVASAREDADSSAPPYFLFDGPTTAEKTFLNSLNSYQQYTL